MNNETKLDGILCADGQTGDVAQAADAAAGTKEYVPPRMEVIPLGPQRLLATSGVVSGPPVQVTITPQGLDYYMRLVDGASGDFRYNGRYYDCGEGLCIGAKGWDFECSDLGSSFMSRYAASVGVMQAYLDSRTDCSIISDIRVDGLRLRCGPGIVMAPSMLDIGFDSAAWTAAEFFAGAQFDACSDGKTFSGTYDGRRFEGTIEEMYIDVDDYRCGSPASPDFLIFK
ncbi:MAG: hypothetical protein IJ729_04535 [Alloprevotella sp.]|nr:hypothetical protein [Alloprevotella sp.]